FHVTGVQTCALPISGRCTLALSTMRLADPETARRIVLNAKVQRPGVCNAAETLLVHEAEAPSLLPRLAAELRAAGVELRGCERTDRKRGVEGNAEKI